MDVIFYLLMSCGQISLVSTYVDRLFIYVVRTNDLSVSCGEIIYLCHVVMWRNYLSVSCGINYMSCIIFCWTSSHFINYCRCLVMILVTRMRNF